MQPNATIDDVLREMKLPLGSHVRDCKSNPEFVEIVTPDGAVPAVLRIDPRVPRGEVHFVQDGKVVGKIINVGEAL